MSRFSRAITPGLAVALALVSSAAAQVNNIKVVTDASPDYTDLDSLVHSVTSNWKSDKDKLWAMFYWTHIARRQTEPMMLHGKAETDPIRQFNDYGYTMCSTVSGINCAIWNHMGYPVKYYDISLHTVPEVFYDNAWHHYDNSLSVVYTLCDGSTVAGVKDIGKTLACEASNGREEPGHIAIYHAMNGTGPDGFLEGADTMRDLRHLGRDSYNPKHLMYRYYFNDWEKGHRYILNLRDGEVYRRHSTRLDLTPGKEDKRDVACFTPNGRTEDGAPIDPDSANARYRIRGNGVRTYTPRLREATLAGALHRSSNIRPTNPGLQPVVASQPAEAIFKVEGANVITSMKVVADLVKTGADDVVAIAISTNNGMTWTDVFQAEAVGANKAELNLIEPVNGAYEVLVKVSLLAKRAPADARLERITFETITQLNSKTLPRLNLGRNTVYVGAGEQTGSIVLWPELQGDQYRSMAVEAGNVEAKPKHEGWNAVLNPASKAGGHVVFEIDAPRDLTKITQGARMYVRNPGSSISFEHSFDRGKTWVKSFKHDNTDPPWDDIHHQVTTDIPPGAKSVRFKYVLDNAGVYSVRMEANHQVADPAARPVEVTFHWSERQADYSLVPRSHTRLVEMFPATYHIHVGGFDHPVMESLVINPKGVRGELEYGYSDGRDAGGRKWVGQWVTYGRNLAHGKPYTVSVPPTENSWEAGDPDGKRLTDGRVGSSYSGGTSYREGPLWKEGHGPEIIVDLEETRKVAAFRIHIHGYPFQDAIMGEVRDEVSVLVSEDGKEFEHAGDFDFRLYWTNVPLNYMWTDEETFGGHNHTLSLDEPVEARYVKYIVKPSRMMVVSEVQVLDGIKAEPFDLKVALPN